MHAVLARYHGIPFYVAAPLSTFDMTRNARDIVIEERGREEITRIGNRTFVPHAVPVNEPGIRCYTDGARERHHYGERHYPPALYDD